VNPWKQNAFELLRSVLRFSVYGCLVTCGLMSSVFLVAVTYQTLTHAWTWLIARVFTGSWAS